VPDRVVEPVPVFHDSPEGAVGDVHVLPQLHAALREVAELVGQKRLELAEGQDVDQAETQVQVLGHGPHQGQEGLLVEGRGVHVRAQENAVRHRRPHVRTHPADEREQPRLLLLGDLDLEGLALPVPLEKPLDEVQENDEAGQRRRQSPDAEPEGEDEGQARRAGQQAQVQREEQGQADQHQNDVVPVAGAGVGQVRGQLPRAGRVEGVDALLGGRRGRGTRVRCRLRHGRRRRRWLGPERLAAAETVIPDVLRGPLARQEGRTVRAAQPVHCESPGPTTGPILTSRVSGCKQGRRLTPPSVSGHIRTDLPGFPNEPRRPGARIEGRTWSDSTPSPAAPTRTC
jgi:hypothetical protein